MINVIILDILLDLRKQKMLADIYHIDLPAMELPT